MVFQYTSTLENADQLIHVASTDEKGESPVEVVATDTDIHVLLISQADQAGNL